MLKNCAGAASGFAIKIILKLVSAVPFKIIGEEFASRTSTRSPFMTIRPSSISSTGSIWASVVSNSFST